MDLPSRLCSYDSEPMAMPTGAMTGTLPVGNQTPGDDLLATDYRRPLAIG